MTSSSTISSRSPDGLVTIQRSSSSVTVFGAFIQFSGL
jgi:hypothetical protein